MQPGGKGPLAYTGVYARRPPDTVVENRPPTDQDINFMVPTLWVDYAALDLYVLVNVAGTATWIYIPTNVADQYITDSGTAIPNAVGDLYILGGTGVQTTATGDTITINSIGAGFTWEVVTDATKDLVAGHAYLSNRGGGVTFSLPATAAVGDTFLICGMNAGGWVLDQQTGQTVDFNGVTTTVTTGTLTSTAANDQIILVCSVADTEFIAFAPVGNLLVDGATSNNSINSDTCYIDVDARLVSVGTEASEAALNVNEATLDTTVFGVSLTSATTNASVGVARVQARSSGTAANGFGPLLQFVGQDDLGADILMGAIGSTFSTITGPTYTSEIRLRGLNASSSTSTFLSVRPLETTLANNNAFFKGALSNLNVISLLGVTTNNRRFLNADSTFPLIIGKEERTPSAIATSRINTMFAADASTTSTPQSLWQMSGGSTGTPATGFGANLLFSLETATVDTYNAGGAIGPIWTDATAGTSTSVLALYYGASNALVEGMRIGASGVSTDGGTNFIKPTQGTFTPTVSGGTTPGAGTYSTQVGRYFSWGSGTYAVIWANLTWSAHTGTGTCLFDLPFTARSGFPSNPPSPIMLWNYSFTAGSVPSIYTTTASAQATLAETTSGAALASVALDTAARAFYTLTMLIA